MLGLIKRAVRTGLELNREALKAEDPTPAQAKSGKYRKAHVECFGLQIAIETPKGRDRRGIGPDGKPWACRMPCHYGYVKRTEGADGDEVDVFLGDDLGSQTVWVIDQIDRKTGVFDEHKCLLGMRDEAQALAMYDASFSDGNGPSRRKAVTRMSLERFREWLASDTTTALKKRQPIDRDGDGKVNDGTKQEMSVGAKAALGAAGVAAIAGVGFLGLRTLRRGRVAARASAASPATGQLLLPSPRKRITDDYASIRPRTSYDANAKLRSGEKLNSEELQAVREMDDFLRLNSRVSKRPVFRGVGRRGGKVFENVRPGDIVEEPGYGSTSKSPRVAAGFGSKGNQNTIVRIHGAKGADIVRAKGERDAGLNAEKEVLLPRGQKFRVINVETRPIKRRFDFGVHAQDMRLIDVEVVKHSRATALKKSTQPRSLRKAAEPDRAAEDAANALAAKLSAAWQRMRNRIPGEIANAYGAGQASGVMPGIPRADYEDEMNEALKPLSRLFAKAGRLTAANVNEKGGQQTIVVTFDLGNRQTAEFLGRYRMALIREISRDQERAVSTVVNTAMLDGLAPAEMARKLRDTIGLTAKQAQHVQNFRQELEELSPKALTRSLRDCRFDRTVAAAIKSGKGLSQDQIDKMVEQYHKRYIAYRAMTVARTESLRAANHGSLMAMQQAVSRGEIDASQIEKTWMATKDERTRDSHRELDGKTVRGLDAPFILSDGTTIRYPHDPAAEAKHTVNCRCTLTYRVLPRPGPPAF